jgi:hypothetical protein
MVAEHAAQVEDQHACRYGTVWGDEFDGPQGLKHAGRFPRVGSLKRQPDCHPAGGW